MRFAAVLLCLFGLSGTAWAGTLFNEQGYRIENYRRATPDTVAGAITLTTHQLQKLIATSAPLLIDVQAITLRAETEEFGIAWLPSKTRWHIAGSSWLPNVGYGELDQKMQLYFETNLQRLTTGNKHQAIVFYCVVDCWMSWNAVRRAAALGYRNIYWYPEGSDGWEQEGLQLVQGTPHPLEVARSTEASFFTHYDPLDLLQVAQQAKSSNRNILLFFETEFCPFCTRMKKTVLIDPDVVDRLQDDFIALTIDIESDKLMQDGSGQTLTKRQFSRQLRIVRTPTLIFFDAEYHLLHKHSGLIATSDEMKKLLEYVHTGAYDNQSWNQYKRQ